FLALAIDPLERILVICTKSWKIIRDFRLSDFPNVSTLSREPFEYHRITSLSWIIPGKKLAIIIDDFIMILYDMNSEICSITQFSDEEEISEARLLTNGEILIPLSENIQCVNLITGEIRTARNFDPDTYMD